MVLYCQISDEDLYKDPTIANINKNLQPIKTNWASCHIGSNAQTNSASGGPLTNGPTSGRPSWLG
jgi:hypothetical protein